MFLRIPLIVLMAVLAMPGLSFALPGDIDGSGRVDGYDLIMLSQAFGSGTGDPKWDPEADLNGDGIVDGEDLAILSAHFGDNGISFGLWVGDLSVGNQRVWKLSSRGNVFRRVGAFSNPLSISSDLTDGAVWVADNTAKTVKKLDPLTGATLLTVTGMDPYSVSVDSRDGSVWVADFTNNRVVKLLPTATDGYNLASDTGAHMVITGFNRPRSVSVNPTTGVVWVADTNSNRVVRLSRGIAGGYNVNQDTGSHTVRTGFSAPYNVSVNAADGTAWVADFNNNQVVRLAATGTAELHRVDGFNRPQHLCVNYVDGSVWVADTNNNRVVRLASDGSILAVAAGYGSPRSVAVNPLDGTAWVTDYHNHRVAKLAANGAELLSIGGFRNPIFAALTPDEVSASKHPTATAGLSSDQVDVGEVVTFTGTGSDPDGTIILYEWDFDGDGVFDYRSTDTGVTTHSYYAAGIYNPVFRLTDNDLLTATDNTRFLRVGTLKAIAGASVSSGDAPLTVNFTADFIDPIDGRIDNYQWDFDGDGKFEYYSETTGNTSHTYTTAGTYLATLKVVDGPAVALDTVTMTVLSSAPTATAGAHPTSGFFPLTVDFTGSGTDPDGRIVLYRWDFNGDGTHDWSSAANGNTTHTYTTAGTYAARFTVTDNDGLTDSVELTIVVGKEPPIATAGASPSSGYPSLTVDFDAAGSSDPDGEIVRYEWDFNNDGEFQFTSETTGVTSHTYDTPGTYIAVLRVTDDDGYQSTDTVLITVIPLDMPIASAGADVLDGTAPLTVDFTGTGQVSDGYAIQEYRWDFGNQHIWVGDTSNNQVVRLSGEDGEEIVRVSGFSRPYAVSVNSVDGTVWVADYNNSQVVKLAADGRTELVRVGGSPTFRNPPDVSVNSADGTVWVADYNNNQVVKLDPEGNELVRAAGFKGPWAVAVNPTDGTVWVADTNNHQAVKLSADGTELKRVSGLNSPQAVSVNPTDGAVWVADFNNNRVIRLFPSVTDGYSVASDTGAHRVIAGFNRPRSVSVNPTTGAVWVADTGSHRVVRLSGDIADAYNVNQDTGSHLVKTGFSSPYAVSVDPVTNDVWVANYGQHQVVRIADDGTELLRKTGFYYPQGVTAATAQNNTVVSQTSGDASYTFSSPGIYRVRFSVTNDAGNVDTRFLTIRVFGVPRVTASASVTTGSAPLEVFFSATVVDGDSLIAQYHWDFHGDGIFDYASVNSPNARHMFSAAGTFEATVRVTDTDGYSSTDAVTITVGQSPPTAFARAAPVRGNAPLTVNFNGMGTDPDGAIVLYEWDFDGDDDFTFSSETTATTSYTYDTAGAYTAVLRITDNDGNSDTDLVSIEVLPSGDPSAIMHAFPTLGVNPLEVRFCGHGFDPDGTITTYEWDFEGDGTFDDSSGTAPTAFGDRMENGTAYWVADPPWALTPDTYFSQSFSWADSPGGNYADNANTSLTSVTIDLSGSVEPRLIFWHRYEFLPSDFGRVEISGNDGLSWTQLAAYTNGTVRNWTKQEFSLAAYAGNPTVKIRFRVTSNAADNAGGWYVDDVWIGDCRPHVYADPGAYTPVLRVTDDEGNRAVATDNIFVVNNLGAAFVWVSDHINNQVVKLSEDGTERARIGGFNRPRGNAVNPTSGDVWVSDTNNNRVVRLSGTTPNHYNISVSTITHDSSPANNPGSLYGDAVLGEARLGDRGILLDGSGDFVLIGDIPAYRMLSWTLEAWVKPGAGSLSGTRIIAGKVSQNKDFALTMRSGRLGMLIYDGGRRFLESATVAVADRWYHVAGVYDGPARTMRLYIDGVFVGEDTRYRADPSNTDPMRIGSNNSNSEYFNGIIDDVRLWNATRSQTDIEGNKDAELTGSEAGLMGYWKLNAAPDTPFHSVVTGLNQPYGLAVDSAEGSVWVANYNASQVVKLAPDGTELSRITGFNRPFAVDVDEERGVVWVSDTYNHRVVRLDLDLPKNFVISPTAAAADSTAGGTTGFVFGNAAAAPGNLSGGVALGGTGDYILLPAAGALDVQSFTVEAWVKASAANTRSIFMRGNSAGGNELYFGFYNSSTLEAVLDAGSVQRFSADANFTDGQWHHVALVYDAVAGELRSYVNAVLYGEPVEGLSVTLDFGGSHALIGAYFGGFNTSLSRYLVGAVDEVRLWNIARSEAEISANKDAPLTGGEPGLAGYWKLDTLNASPSMLVTGFNTPHGISVDRSDGSVWVADYNNNQVVKLGADGSELHRRGGYDRPLGVSANRSDGSVWMTDYNIHQVAKLTTDSAEMVRAAGFSNPYDLAVNSEDGTVWVADYNNNQVVKLAPNGTELLRLGGFNRPLYVAVDSAARGMNQPPLAITSAMPASGDAPLVVTFTGSAEDSDAVMSYEWDFGGDGVFDWHSAASGNTSHTYDRPGTYSPVFRVIDNRGMIGFATPGLVYVGPLTVSASVSPASGNAPLNTTLSGVVTGLSPGRNIVLFEWDYEGDGVFDYTSTATASTPRRYNTAGDYAPVLRVTDTAGNQALGSASVVVNQVPPSANNYASPTSGVVPLTVNLTGSGSDADGSVVRYEWDYDGDGVYDWFSTTSPATTFTYRTAGTYTLTLRVTDNDGLTATASRTITVNPRQDPPVVTAAADVVKGSAPLAVNFTGTGTDPDDGIITLYEWDFEGDGVYDYSSEETGDAAFLYNTPGQFSAALRVTDADNLTGIDRVLITVTPEGFPKAVANADPTAGPVALNVSFDATGSSASEPDGHIALYEWVFGDEAVWVADYNNNQVVKLKGPVEDRRLSGFNRPVRLAVNQTDGSVWVSDTNNHQVVKLRGSDGLEMARVGGFNAPQGLAVDETDGSVWVSGQNNNNVVKLSSGGTELFRVSGFNNSTSVALDGRTRNVWVADRSNHQVAKLARDGTGLVRVSGFNQPWWVSVNQSDGSVWVADRYNNRVVRLGEDIPNGYNLSNFTGLTEDASPGGNWAFTFGDVAPAEGALDGGGAFDGSGDYLQIPDSQVFRMESWTLEAWIKPNIATGIRIVAGKVSQNKDFALVTNGNKMGVLIYDGGRKYLLTPDAFTVGQWYHLAGVYDAGAKAVRLYVDGTLIVEETGRNSDTSNTNPVRIGSNNSNSEYFNGVIDEVRIWNVARSAAEIPANKDGELTGSEPGLVGYWPLNSIDRTPRHKVLGGFREPLVVSVNSTDGTAWVCDYLNNEMVKVAADAGFEILRVGGFNRPHEAFVNPSDGTVWVADYNGNRVVKLSPAGREIASAGGVRNPTSVVPDMRSSGYFRSTTTGHTNHIYYRDGEYVATLRVTDDVGNTDSDSVTIRAGTFPRSVPTAYPTTGPAPLTVLFSAVGMSPSGSIEYYYWDFDGSGTINWTSRISDSQTFTYNTPGTYIATQRVVDNRGFSDTASITITVTPPSPFPSAQAMASPTEGHSPLQVNFTGLGRDSDGFITKFEWDFEGDGTFDFESTTGGAASHTYEAEGVYNAVLRVTDNDGNTGTDSVRMKVKPVGAPTAQAGATATSGDASLTVHFSAPVTEGETIVLYEWDFDGDGVFDYVSTTNGNATHTYGTAGDYTAVLRVTNALGFSDTDVVTITVSLGVSAVLSTDSFEPYQGEGVNINSVLTGAVDKFTLKIKDRVGNTVRTLVSGQPRAGGYHTDAWDGRNEAGRIVDTGVYFYVIEYEVGGKQFLYDVTGDVNTATYYPTVVYPENFNPFSAETNFFRYTLPTKSEATVYISPFGGVYGLAGPRIKTLLEREPQKAGSHVLVWDGTDDSGALVEPHTYVIAVFGWRLPENAVMVTAGPVISDLLVTPAYLNPKALPYDPVYEATFSYTLSWEADVTATLSDVNNFVVRTFTIDNVPAQAGNTIVWNGKSDSGDFVAPGTYRLKLRATDRQGNPSRDANTLIVVFY